MCILRHFSLCVPTGCYGSPWLSVRHHGRTLSCRAGSPYGILLARNRKCPSMVGYLGYAFTPGLDQSTTKWSMCVCIHTCMRMCCIRACRCMCLYIESACTCVCICTCAHFFQFTQNISVWISFISDSL